MDIFRTKLTLLLKHNLWHDVAVISPHGIKRRASAVVTAKSKRYCSTSFTVDYDKNGVIYSKHHLFIANVFDADLDKYFRKTIEEMSRKFSAPFLLIPKRHMLLMKQDIEKYFQKNIALCGLTITAIYDLPQNWISGLGYYTLAGKPWQKGDPMVMDVLREGRKPTKEDKKHGFLYWPNIPKEPGKRKRRIMKRQYPRA